MKRYLLFVFSEYYPDGGINDLHGDYETLEEAVKEKEKIHKSEIYHIYDLELKDIVMKNYKD
jgi:hypothetical protein